MSDNLDRELAFYRSKRDQWIAEGRLQKWCVVQGEELLGFYEDFDTAYAAGLEQFGEGTFLVKQVQPSEPTERILHAFPF